jgi:SAM-dependent methyltransferase
MREKTKQVVSRIARRLRLLKALDYTMFLLHCIRNRKANRFFSRSHPGFRVPPLFLSYEAFGHTSREQYYRTGTAHAELIAQTFREHLTHPEPRVCEWGCGPGRVVRYLPEKLAGTAASIYAVDLNPRSVAWCRRNLSGVSFEHNGLHPPLSFPDGFFDFIYAISVFTHLDEQGWAEWIEELYRVTRENGVVFFTTLGKNSLHKLLPDEEEHFLCGRPVFRTNARKGKNWHVAYHPESYVRANLPSEFSVITHQEKPTFFALSQDIWIVKKSGG